MQNNIEPMRMGAMRECRGCLVDAMGRGGNAALRALRSTPIAYDKNMRNRTRLGGLEKLVELAGELHQ